MDSAQIVIGACIRAIREMKKFTLEALAERVGISYQYLSGVETGKENFTLKVLEQISDALGYDVKALVLQAYDKIEKEAAPKIDPSYFRDVPLPPGLTREALARALDATQAMFFVINRTMKTEVGRTLNELIQANNFSGIVSNILSDAMNRETEYKHNHHQRYPDLVRPAAEGSAETGLEVKATINIGKGGESHNGHSGWHMVVCFAVTTKGVEFIHVMFAELNGHSAANPDWKYCKSNVNNVTGSQRTETYVTNLTGTTKLRDGSVYVDPKRVAWTRWRQQRPSVGELPGDVPEHSIFFARTAKTAAIVRRTSRGAKKPLKAQCPTD